MLVATTAAAHRPGEGEDDEPDRARGSGVRVVCADAPASTIKLCGVVVVVVSVIVEMVVVVAANRDVEV